MTQGLGQGRPGPATSAPVLPVALRSLRSAGYVDLLAAQALPLAVGFGITLASAAVLGPGARGVLTVQMTAATVAGALAFGSLHVPVVAGLRVGDRRPLGHGIRLVGGIWAGLTLVGVLLVVTGGGHGASGALGPRPLGWGLVGGGLVLVQLFGVRVLQGLGRHAGYQRAVLAQVAVYATAAVAALLVAPSPHLVFAAWCTSVAVGSAVAARLLRAVLPPRVPGALRATSWRVFLGSALANNVGSIGQMVVLRGDVLVVGLVLGAADAGVYGLALSLTELTLVLPEVIALAVFGNRARMDRAAWLAQVRRAVRWDLVLAVLAAVVVMGVAVVLSRGPLSAYGGLVPLVAVVLPGAVLAGYTRIALAALQAQGDGRSVWHFGVLSLVLALGYLPGAWFGGMLGTALVSSAAYAVGAAHLHRALRRTVAATC